jgi:uncharacterized C2H2 Zn-finger protein
MKKRRTSPSVRVGWICPHCGEENETVQLEGLATFQVELDDLGKMVRFDAVTPPGEPFYYRCPRCDEMLTIDKFEAAVEHWIQRLRGKNPKRYAEILAHRLRST